MVNISRSFLASAYTLCSQCTNRDETYEAMKQTIKTSLEYKRAIYVKNLYKQLKKDRIGTTVIETMSSKQCSTLPKHRQRTLVKVIVNWKLQDAHKDLRERKSANTEMWRKQKCVMDAAGVTPQYKRLWRREVTIYENKCADEYHKKIRHLRGKYMKKEETVPDEIDGIVLKDQELTDEYTSAPRMYGGVDLTNDEHSLLELPTKYATYEKVNRDPCEAEIEKSLAKLRWESKKDDDPRGNELPREEKGWHDQHSKTMDFRLFRSTDLPFNSRIIVPPPLDNTTEIALQCLKGKLLQCTKRYIKSANNTTTNLTPEQQAGLESLVEKKKNKEVVIFETDKSKRFACDTIDNYKLLGDAHVRNDEVVTMADTKQFEIEINAHTEMWTRILNAGEKTGQYDRIKTSMKTKNNPPAPLSILRKDHKQCEDPVVGPPGRPVCGGDVSYNRKLSHLMSVLLTDVYVGEKTVCASTEELLAEVNIINDEGALDDTYIVGSMDVEALYPSLDIEFTVDKVCELLYDSSVNIEGIDIKELGLYLSLTNTDDELRALGVQSGCPKRRARRGPRPIITGCGTNENKVQRHGPWRFPNASRIDATMRRKMLVEAVRIVLRRLLETHTYDFAGEIRRQKEGGAIGMELTGVVAQIFMVWWDKQLTTKLEEVNIRLKLHERYVDDTNMATKQTPVGGRYENGVITITDQSIAEDANMPNDERTMKLIQTIANTIHRSIRMTIDYPSRYNDHKVPMLDLKMWIEEIEGVWRIVYEHYEKAMATKMLIHAKSAIPVKVKRTVLTQEMLRIILHCSKYVPYETVRQHLSNFTKKMQYSGYGQAMRYDVAKSAIKAYQTMVENEAHDIRPINRPKNWLRVERIVHKEKKKREWYKQGGFDSVLFVPSTPKGKLKHMYENEIKKSGIRIKVVERTGRTLKSQLQTSNPFKEGGCGRNDCFVCTTTNRGNCQTDGITYRCECQGENCRKRKYKGETSSNGYTRGVKHMTDLNGRNVNNSPLWRHCLEEHNGEEQRFQMSVTGSYRNDAMLRQIAEAVQIENSDPGSLMNDRAEWNMTPIPRSTITV